MWKLLSMKQSFYFFFIGLVLQACCADAVPVENGLDREAILNLARLERGWADDVAAAYGERDAKKQYEVGAVLLRVGEDAFVREGMRLLDLSINQGIVAAGYALGVFLLDSPNPRFSNIPQGLARLQWAAGLGDMESQAHLGALFQEGHEGVPVNLAEACRYFMLAAEQGDLYSQMEAADFLYWGAAGVPQDLGRARHFYGLAYDQHQHPGACQHLVAMCLQGEGGPQDFSRARHLLQGLAASGLDGSIRMAASYIYGFMCLCGIGGAHDFPDAEAYLIAAAGNFPRAYGLLGDFYIAQQEPDWAGAYLVYGLGADAGDVESMMGVAGLLEIGRPGVPFNEYRALYWYQQALEAGVQDAFFSVRRLGARLRRVVPESQSPTKKQKR